MGIKYTYTNLPPPERVVREPGEYPFTVVNYVRKLARSGNELIELKVAIDEGGNCFENLVFTEKAWWKIDQFLNCILATKPLKVGVQVDFGDEMLLGARGMAAIGQEEFQGKDGTMKKKNVIVEFLAKEAPPAAELF